MCLHLDSRQSWPGKWSQPVAVLPANDSAIGLHICDVPNARLYECQAIMYLCVCSHVLWRSSERRSPSCLLGAWPGHPVLPQLPARLHCQAVQAPLSRLWPRSVRRLLPRKAARSVTGLGPPRPGVHKLQPESRGTLTGCRLPSSEQRRQPLAPSARSLSLLYLCSSDGSVLYLWKGSF